MDDRNSPANLGSLKKVFSYDNLLFTLSKKILTGYNATPTSAFKTVKSYETNYPRKRTKEPTKFVYKIETLFIYNSDNDWLDYLISFIYGWRERERIASTSRITINLTDINRLRSCAESLTQSVSIASLYSKNNPGIRLARRNIEGLKKIIKTYEQ
ncbi:Uncharacterised protein [Legionella busanensis]|uniref:Uncharacterized protein n=1 Tax=Legionella busanensis TaxID=190655 RepID=A0A378JJH9_9GAMM|nr:hypothetical protein [Legionella busanensis]STX50473.1 Uncharacterised protein [Legionella busanensis]